MFMSGVFLVLVITLRGWPVVTFHCWCCGDKVVTIVTAHYDSAHATRSTQGSFISAYHPEKIKVLSTNWQAWVQVLCWLWISSSSHWLWPFLYQNTGPRLLSPGYCMGYSMRSEDEEDGRVSSDGPHSDLCWILSQSGKYGNTRIMVGEQSSTFEQYSC